MVRILFLKLLYPFKLLLHGFKSISNSIYTILMLMRNRSVLSSLFTLSIIWLILMWTKSRNRHVYLYREFIDDPDVVSIDNSDLYRPNYDYSHPFDNTCRFPMLRPEDPSIEKFVNHSRQIQCPAAEFEHLVTQGRNGELMIGHPSNGYISSLYPKISEYNFTGDWKRLPINRRFKINQTQFVIKCWSNITYDLIYHNAFIGLPEKSNVPSSLDRYSIAILEIDSTSRNQFFRHMPHTLRVMRENDFQIMNGYTKVGDNSAINTMRSLEVACLMRRQLTQNQTFSNLFDHIKMVYDDMKKEGCAVMFNDDIGELGGGLFHYQSFDGFRVAPTDYYFRPYYNYIYKNFDAQSSFSTMYKNKCHFSFNHFSYLTHAEGNNLELYDLYVADALLRMKNVGVFDNTVVIVMGDHGQRIHQMKYTYYGKVEERMPLASIHLPDKFKRAHPQLYRQLIKNTNRFTSTFDLHETLKLLLKLKYTDGMESEDPNKQELPQIPTKERVGRTLFEEIPKDRNCTDAKVPLNFCSCMQKLDDSMNMTLAKPEMAILIDDYLHKTLSPQSCVQRWSLTTGTKPMVYGISRIVRYGPRYIDEWESRITTLGKTRNIFREIVEIERNYTLTIGLTPTEQIEPPQDVSVNLMFRIQFQQNLTNTALITDPWIINSPCQLTHLDQFCIQCNQPSTVVTLNSNTTSPNILLIKNNNSNTSNSSLPPLLFNTTTSIVNASRT
ncbi:hypothetical protein M3Y97_00963000 [Aphelenchoides bicaudatus]|nr:hypothetical protein M3Y97_00963000 [Aphelenchoides bicaudatus]